MVLGIEHHVFHILSLQQLREPFRFLNRGGAHQNRAAFGADLLNLIGHGKILFFFRAVDNVSIFLAPHLPVRRNYDH